MFQFFPEYFSNTEDCLLGTVHDGKEMQKLCKFDETSAELRLTSIRLNWEASEFITASLVSLEAMSTALELNNAFGLLCGLLFNVAKAVHYAFCGMDDLLLKFTALDDQSMNDDIIVKGIVRHWWKLSLIHI